MNSGQANHGFNFRQFIAEELPEAKGEPYSKINREERHLAAILFHLLQIPFNLDALLKYACCDGQIDCRWKIDYEEFGIYFEYSYLRDLWDAMGRGENSAKRCAIVEMLRKNGASDELLGELPLGTHKFNEFFIGKNRAADGMDQNPDLGRYIQSPGNWRLPALDNNLKNDCDIVAACKIKWSFNAKPDLVIHTNNNHALCIELKLGATEGSYPAKGAEKKLLRDRKNPLFGAHGTCQFPLAQTKLQEFLMERLLGFDECRFLVISRGKDVSPTKMSWGSLLGMLHPNWNDLPNYMKDALKHAAELGPSVPANGAT